MQTSQPDAARWGRIKTISAFAIALGSTACAFTPGPDTVTVTGASHVAGCVPVPAENPDRLAIEADIAAFARTIPASDSVRFEVQNCLMDGQVSEGRTIVLSTRLVRLPEAQRHFIIAHELGHHQLGHRMQIAGMPAAILSQSAQTRQAASVTEADVTEIGATERAHRMEFEADAHAVRMMHAEGVDPEEAARMFDNMGVGVDSDTHPAYSRRAQAIRDLIATLDSSLPTPAPGAPK